MSANDESGNDSRIFEVTIAPIICKDGEYWGIKFNSNVSSELNKADAEYTPQVRTVSCNTQIDWLIPMLFNNAVSVLEHRLKW
jgi:hypothetical protein